MANESENAIYRIPIRNILYEEGIFQKFNRYDLVVRAFAIDEYYGKNTFGRNLYEKMQMNRIKEKQFKNMKYEKCWFDFVKLIEKFEDKDYRYCYPIRFNKESRLINGSHRVALAMYKKISVISYIYSVDVNELGASCFYGLDWFEKNGFLDRELELMEKRCFIIQNENYDDLYCCVWCPAVEMVGKIERIIHDLLSPILVKKKNLFFVNDNDCESFIRQIYEEDTMSEERLKQKISDILTFSRERKVIMLQIKLCFADSEKYKAYYLHRKDALDIITTFKQKVRKILLNEMKDYYYDNAFHCGVSFGENIHLQRIWNGQK